MPISRAVEGGERDAKAAVEFADEVRSRHAHLVEDHVRRGRGAQPHLVLEAGDAQARRAPLDDEQRDAVAAALRFGLHERQEDAGAVAVRDVRLLAAQHEVVAVLARGRAHGGHVAAAAGLGEAEGADRLPGDEGAQVALLLLVAAEALHERGREPARGGHQQPGRGVRARELLESDRQADLAEARPAPLLRERDPEEPHLAEEGDQLVGDVLALLHLHHARPDLALGEVARGAAQRRDLRRQASVCVHERSSPFLATVSAPWRLHRRCRPRR